MSATVLLLVASLAPNVQASDITLQVGITGRNTLEGLKDPVRVLQRPEVAKVFQEIADQPRSSAYIDDALTGSEVDLDLLVELGLIKPWDGAYAIDFNYLTVEDHVVLIAMLEPYAGNLAESYRDRWSEFEAIFKAYGGSRVPPGEVAFAVLGAMSLDWDGLDITAEKRLRVTAEALPEGRSFVVWAKEQSPEVSLKELYWGSHNEVVDGVRFTTFGDHHALPRLAFPDLLWSTSSRVAAIDGAARTLRIRLYKALEPYYQQDFLRDVGSILCVLRRAPATHGGLAEAARLEDLRAAETLHLLEELQYIEQVEGSYWLATPFFSVDDKPMIDAARALSRQLIDDWLDRNDSAVETSLRELTALRYAVPYEQLFTEIWHYLFGLTNRGLVQSGHFADPYAGERLSQGMIPFAFDTEVMNQHQLGASACATTNEG
jgi:hypothetical protein